MMNRTFPVPVDGVGTFTFRRRTMRDQLKIEAEATSILGAPLDGTDGRLSMSAVALATLGVLTVAAPDGWDLDAVDPLDEEAVARVFAVYEAFRNEEARFRGGAKP